MESTDVVPVTMREWVILCDVCEHGMTVSESARHRRRSYQTFKNALYALYRRAGWSGIAQTCWHHGRGHTMPWGGRW